MRHHTLLCERVVVRTPEELLLGKRVGAKSSAVLLQRRAEVGAFPPAQEHGPGGHLFLGHADHLELEIGGDVLQRNRRKLAEPARAGTAQLFAAEADEEDVAAGAGPAAKARASSSTAVTPDASSFAPL